MRDPDHRQVRPRRPLPGPGATCIDARRAIAEGHSPALEKQRAKRRLPEALNFGAFGERWFRESRMAGSTRAVRRAIYERDILPKLRNRLLTEINADDLRTVQVKDRGARQA